MKQEDIINEPQHNSSQEIPYQRLTIEKAKSTIDWLLWDFGKTTSVEEQADKIRVWNEINMNGSLRNNGSYSI